MLQELKEGRGPIFIDTATAMRNLAASMTPEEIRHLEAEAWEDFLDMTIGQCGVWAGENIEPDKEMSELMPTEPYLLGSHAGCAGIWCSGPDDIPGTPDHYHWGYNRMTTVRGLFTAGDGVGGVRAQVFERIVHRGSDCGEGDGQVCDGPPGSEGPNCPAPSMISSTKSTAPCAPSTEHRDYTTTIDVNPNYITPRMFQLRLQKVMDEYVAGVSTMYQTNAAMLKLAEKKLGMLREDALKLRAKDLHELLRAWENYHRLIAAFAHMKHIQFREETRYPGYYYRTDFSRPRRRELALLRQLHLRPRQPASGASGRSNGSSS